MAERATLAISASTGNAVFSGSVTGSTIIGGTLNIAGNAIIDSAGLLTATGVTITGDIRGTSGYFGTLANGWSIGATGLTAVGTGNITGGSIVGTQFTSVGNVFSVSPAGFLIATSGTIGGMTLSASSIVSATGGFSVTSAGVLTAISGSIGGFTLSSTSIFSSSNLVIETSGTITGGNSSTIFYGFANIGGGSVTGERLIVAGTSALNGNTGVLGNLTVTNSCTFGAVTQQFEFLSSSGNVRVFSTYGNAVSGRSMQISSSGLYGTTASTERKKHEIQPYSVNSEALLRLGVKSFKYKAEIDPDQQTQHGFIAEEAQALGLEELIQYDSTGVPDYFAYDKLPIFLLQLIQELKAEINILKGA